MSAFEQATQQVKKLCRKCGREFLIDAYLAPKLAFDRCDDCTPALVKERFGAGELIATSDDPPGTTRIEIDLDALRPDLRYRIARSFSAVVHELIKQDSAAPASAEDVAEVKAAA